MPRNKSAIDRIDHHEKICRLMQKQRFESIDRMENRIARMEKWIIGGCIGVVLAVLSQHL